MNEFLIWAIPEDNRLRVGALPVGNACMPPDAEIIAKVMEDDLKRELQQVKSKVKRGWGLSALKEEYGMA